MKMTIKRGQLGVNRYSAKCRDCKWAFKDEKPDSRKGNIHARRHVSRTGHSVVVKKEVIYKYFKVADNDNH